MSPSDGGKHQAAAKSGAARRRQVDLPGHGGPGLHADRFSAETVAEAPTWDLPGVHRMHAGLVSIKRDALTGSYDELRFREGLVRLKGYNQESKPVFDTLNPTSEPRATLV
jgi:hypothetical protein